MVSTSYSTSFHPCKHTHLDQNLRRDGERLASHIAKVVLVCTDTTSKTTKSEGRTDHEGVADLLRVIDGLIDGDSGIGLGDLLVDFAELVGKELTILGINDNRNLSSEDFHSILLKDTRLV